MKISELDIVDVAAETTAKQSKSTSLDAAKIVLVDNLLENLSGDIQDETRRLHQAINAKRDSVKTVETDIVRYQQDLNQKHEELELEKLRGQVLSICHEILDSVPYISPNSRAYIIRTAKRLDQFSLAELIQRKSSLDQYNQSQKRK